MVSAAAVGQRERITQKRVIRFFVEELKYQYLGDWHTRANNRNIEPALLTAWLEKRGVAVALIPRVLRQLEQAASLGGGRHLYDANKEIYGLLRYGVKDKEGAGEQNQTIWLVDWQEPEANDFAIAEEVTVAGENKKRPDLVLYINGIALGVIELKRSTVSVAEGIRQNLDNQQQDFIRNFFTTMQLVIWVVTFVAMLALTLFIRYSRMGRACRACAEDLKMASLLGINTDRVIALTFVIGAAMAAVAGVLLGQFYGVINPYIGFMAGMKAFTAAVLGGIGSIPGAMIGGLILGIAEALSSAYLSTEYKDVVSFALLIVVLLVMPTGILGRPEVEKV